MRKIIKITIIAFAVCAFANVNSAQAASNNANVRATLNGQCFANDAAAVTIDLGVVTFTAASSDAMTANGNLSFWCTKNTAYTAGTTKAGVVSGTGLASTMTNGTDTVNYTLTVTGASTATEAGTGSGKATPVLVSVQGDIAAAAFDNISAGIYQETIDITLLP